MKGKLISAQRMQWVDVLSGARAWWESTLIKDLFIAEASPTYDSESFPSQLSLSNEENAAILEAESLLHLWRFTEESKRNLYHVSIWQEDEEQGKTLDPSSG